MTAAERGMALPLALLALVVIGALVAGGFAAALLEQRIGRNLLFAAQAEGAAAAGALGVLDEWTAGGFGLLAPGDSAVLPAVRLPGGAAHWSTVSRLNGELFLVRVEGVRADADGRPLARREVGLWLRVADAASTGSPPVTPLPERGWTGGF
jgi:hypothetical protein